MKSITSRQNPWFKRVRDAIREHAGEIVIEGPKAVADAIAAGWTPIAVITSAARADETSALRFSDELFGAIADTKTSQGVLALFERPAGADVFARTDTVAIALDGIQDPGNVGTIVRLAAAFDASGVALLPGCADPFSPKAIRASAGAILSVPVATVSAADLRNVFYADAAGEPQPPPPRNAVLVFGSEGSGVSDDVRRRGKAIAITTSGRVESLNVAASAAILLWQSFMERHRIRWRN